MSNRMREPFHTLIWKASEGYNDSWSQVDPEVLEKFAELIVQECVKVCMAEREAHQEQSAHGTGRSSDFAFGSVMSAERIADTINAQFGFDYER